MDHRFANPYASPAADTPQTLASVSAVATEVKRLTIAYDLTSDDLQALVREILSRPVGRKQIRRAYFTGLMRIALPILVVAAFALQKLDRFDLTLMFVGAVAIYAVLWGLMYRHQLDVTVGTSGERPFGIGLGRHEMTISSDGIHESHRHGEARHAWTAVSEVFEGPEHVFVSVLPSGVYVVPKRAFFDAESLTEFRQQVANGAKRGETERDGLVE